MKSIPLIDQAFNFEERVLMGMVPPKAKDGANTKLIEIECTNVSTIRIDLKTKEGSVITAQYPSLGKLFDVIKKKISKSYQAENELFKFLNERTKHDKLVRDPLKDIDSRKIERMDSLGTDLFKEHGTQEARLAALKDLKTQVLAADEANSMIFDSINHEGSALEKGYVDAIKYNQDAQKPETLEDLIYRIILNLYREPFLVRTFFCVAAPAGTTPDPSKIYNTKDVFNAQGIFKAGANMRIAYSRDGATVSRNAEFVNNLYENAKQTYDNPAINKLAKKSEGIFAYFESTSHSSEIFSGNDYSIGYIPFVLANDTFESLTRRSVEIELLNDLGKKASFVEHGWIQPQAMNVTKNSTLFDNKLLFHWIGESLGADSPIVYTDDSDTPVESEEELQKIIEGFIKEHIYSKTISVDDDSLIPLLEGAKYRFTLVPINTAGGIPIAVKDDLKPLMDHIAPNQPELLSKEITFSVLDPLNSPELVPKTLGSISQENNGMQVILKHPDRSRTPGLQQDFVLLPPRVDYNVAKWLGTFDYNAEGNDSTFNEDFKWILSLDEKLPPRWNFASKINYVFDKRVLKNRVYVSRPGEMPVSISHLRPSGTKMADVEAIPFEITSINSRSSEVLALDGKNIRLKIAEGQNLKIILGYEGADRPSREITVVNAVPTYDPQKDGKIEIKPAVTTTEYFKRVAKGTELKFIFTKVNLNVAGYFYIFRRYLKVDPSEQAGLPDKRFLLNKRNRAEEVTNIEQINKETDESLFNTILKEPDDTETAESVEITNLGATNGAEIFSIDNIFELSEVFGEKMVELLDPMDVDGTESKKFKIDFTDSGNLLPDTYPVNLKFKENVRAKKVDYINAKIYSKHLKYFQNEMGNARSLLKFDHNVPLENLGIIHHSAYAEKEILANIPPPKFDLKLLFLNNLNSSESGTTKNLEMTRKAFLMVTFDKAELNVLSDDDYFGIDFNAETEQIAETKMIGLKTDIGTDFTINSKRDTAISDSSVKLGLCIEKEQRGYKLLNSFTGSTIGKVFRSNSIAYVKPLFLYNENIGFFLWDVSQFLSGANLDPFLKVSICRAYPLDAGLIKFARSESSKPEYIQLSSTRSIKLAISPDKILIEKTTTFTQEKSRSHYVFCFYEKNAGAFKEPVTLTRMRSDNALFSQSYIHLKADSPMGIVSESGGKFTIQSENKKVYTSEEEIISKDQLTDNKLFDLRYYSFQLFEFYAYDNVGLKTDTAAEIDTKIEKLINAKNFNPFSDPNFKLIFKAPIEH